MIERRRRFFKGDSLLDMPIFPRFLQFLSICMRIPKRNWHYHLLPSGHCYIKRCRKVGGSCRYCNEQKLELSSLQRISNGTLMSQVQTVMTNGSWNGRFRK